MGSTNTSNPCKVGSKQPENMSLGTPDGLKSYLEPFNFGHFRTHFGLIWGLVGAILGPNDIVGGVKPGKKGSKRDPSFPGWIPSQDTATRPLWRPSWSPRAPNGPVWGRLGAKLANKRTLQAENANNGAQQDPEDGCLGSWDPSGGPQNPNGEFQFLALFWG